MTVLAGPSLTLRPPRERAIRCYAACGFREVSREPAAVHLDGRWHDDVIMEAYSAALGVS